MGHRLVEIEPYVKGNTAVWAAVEKVNAATERLLKTPEYEKTKTALEALPAEMLRDYARLEAGAAKEALRPKVQELIHALAVKEHPAGETAKIKATEQDLWKKVGAAEKSMQELDKTAAYQELIKARKNPELGALGKEYLILGNVIDRNSPLEEAFSPSRRAVLEQQYGFALDPDTAGRIDKAAQEQRGQVQASVQQVLAKSEHTLAASKKASSARNQRLGAVEHRLGEMLGELEGVDLKSISKELEQLNAQIAREREEIQATLSGNVSGGALGTFSHPGAAHRTSVPPQKHNR